MADKASIVAFVLSLLGATYQMLSYGLAFLVDNRYNYNYYFGIYGFFGVIATLVVFWAMSHLLDTRGYRNFTWPSIILAMGAANLGNLIIQLATPTTIGPLLSSTVPIDVILTLIPAPILLIIGGLLGFVPVRSQHQP